MATVVLTDEQEVDVATEFKTAAGNPGVVDGVPTWASSNDAVATVVPSEDGKSAVVRSAGLGTCQVSVTADADLGEGVRQIVGTLDVQVNAAEVVTAGIVPGTPRPKVG